VLLDALGRPFDVRSVLLLLKPVHTFGADGISITYNPKPLGFEPVVIIPDSMESDCQIWVIYAREYYSTIQHDVQVDGFCGQKHPSIYLLAKNVGEL
jgi:hypothetical protein